MGVWAGSVVAARFVTNDWGEVAARRRPGNAAQAAAASRTSPRVGHREAVVRMVGEHFHGPYGHHVLALCWRY